MSTSLSTVDTGSSDLTRDLLVIERLAAALEKAAGVDEIKDVRDRAMAIQLYTRKKAGGLAACQAAGRVVTDATLKLARLYHDEKGSKGGNPTLVREQELPKAAVARAADMDPAALSKLKPLVAMEPDRVRAATKEIEAAGEVATPAALLRHVTAVSSQSDYDGDEWYTPTEIVQAARDVLGEIDLDPASNPHAQKVVRAAKYFTKQDDALTKEWNGRVFCNPPYSTTLVQRFTDHLLHEVDAKRVKAAIYLVNNCTDTGWFHALAERFPFCLTKGRLAFYNRHGAKQAARQGQTIFYVGGARARFAKAFADVGVVVERVS